MKIGGAASILRAHNNSLYWAFNMPLQAWPTYDANSEIVDYVLLNYMPRLERCEMLEMSSVVGDQPPEEFFETAAKHLENLARQFRRLANKEIDRVYYPDEVMGETTK